MSRSKQDETNKTSFTIFGSIFIFLWFLQTQTHTSTIIIVISFYCSSSTHTESHTQHGGEAHYSRQRQAGAEQHEQSAAQGEGELTQSSDEGTAHQGGATASRDDDGWRCSSGSLYKRGKGWMSTQIGGGRWWEGAAMRNRSGAYRRGWIEIHQRWGRRWNGTKERRKGLSTGLARD